MQGLLAGKFATADDVPKARARTRHFSDKRPLTTHGQAGFEAETFAAIEKIQTISQQLSLPMAKVALAWLLHQPGVTSVIVGGRQPEQVRRNVEAVEVRFTAAEVSELEAATAAIKQHFGADPDMWQSASRYR